MSAPVPEEKWSAIKAALLGGRKIEAIKIYRECAGTGLAEAKDAVDKLEAEMRAAEPEKFATPAGGKGCSGMLALCCAVGFIAALWITSRAV